MARLLDYAAGTFSIFSIYIGDRLGLYRALAEGGPSTPDVGSAGAQPAGTGTVMRTDTLRRYALDAGFRDVEVLPIENFFFRF